MSTAPRPWSRSPRTSGSNAPLVQPSPGGTTSRCPAKARCGPGPATQRDHILDRPVGLLADDEAVDLEARATASACAEHVEHRAARGRHALGGDQRLGQIDDLGQGALLAMQWRRHCPSSTSIQSRRPTRPAIRPTMRRVVKERWYRRLAPAGGVDRFRVQPCHAQARRLVGAAPLARGRGRAVIMLAGEAVLVDDDGEHVMRPGDIAAFPKNDGNGHVLQNRVGRRLRVRRDRRDGRQRLPLSRYRHAPLRQRRRATAARTGAVRHGMLSALLGSRAARTCSITHSSSCAAAIQSCMKGWLSTASTYGDREARDGELIGHDPRARPART